MKTQILSANESNIQKAALEIRRGNLIGMPTETVYGLAANAMDETAALKIFQVKGRPANNPLIVHLASREKLPLVASYISPLAKQLMDAFTPGPLTIIFPKSKTISPIITGNLETVAVRFPAHPIARRLITLSDTPIAAPSANTSGKPSPTTASHVFHDLNGKIPFILDGGSCEIGLESTIIKLHSNGILLLRPGRITKEMLEEFAPVTVHKGVLSNSSPESIPESPGMLYRHYAPNAEVILLKGNKMQIANYVNQTASSQDYALVKNKDANLYKGNIQVIGDSYSKQAQQIFAVLRDMDKRGAKKVFISYPEEKGLALALCNRLLRAASFQMIDLTTSKI